MQALLDYLQTASIPRSERPNVCSSPVRSLTLGLVSQRNRGYGVAGATTLDQMRLLQLLFGLANDPAIDGTPPDYYTSICLNVDFACDLHTDSHNSGASHIVAFGSHTGGDLFVEKDVDDGRERPCAFQHGNTNVQGISVGVKRHWYRFDGSRRHCTLPYIGFRCSAVYFSVPIDRCGIADLARLHHLGFRTPCVTPLGVAAPWPYHVFVCSTRRSNTIKGDTLSTLLADRSVPPHAVTLCVRDDEDAESYRKFGLHIIVSDGAGLPEQRHLCTRYLPRGSWCMFLDDDVMSIKKPDHLSVHELIMLGFLAARQRHTLIWGANVSSNPRSLRQCYSTRLGLVCGFFFGIITHPDLRCATGTSDTYGGAAEDIERSIRYYVHSGILRLNFVAVCARNKTNSGGLQCYYGSREHRCAAHSCVVVSLAGEFPDMLAIDPSSPNGCKLRHQANPPEECNADQHTGACDIGEDTDDPEEDTASLNTPPPPACQPPPTRKAIASKSVCGICGKSYARYEDLRHHMHTHGGAKTVVVVCPVCAKPFKRRKDMLLHIRLKRCGSSRGRPYAAAAPKTNDEQCPISELETECVDDSAFDQGKTD